MEFVRLIKPEFYKFNSDDAYGIAEDIDRKEGLEKVKSLKLPDEDIETLLESKNGDENNFPKNKTLTI